MDLNNLLNQTKIGVSDEKETNNAVLTDETSVEEIDNAVCENVSENVTDNVLVEENDDNSEPELDPRFSMPWNKLEKGSKMNRILLFIESEKINQVLSDNLAKELKTLLFRACETGMFNKISDVKYDQESGIIESFKYLEFNENTKKYKLKTGGTKSRSVSKSRSNLDRLMKKK